MPSILDLQFSLELEVVSAHRKMPFPNWHGIADGLSQELLRVGVANQVNDDTKKQPKQRHEWSLIQDVSILDRMAQNKNTGLLLGLIGWTLISPLYKFRDTETWGLEIINIWRILSRRYTTASTTECNIRIQISPKGQNWNLPELKRIAKTIVYFEQFIDSILPFDHRNHIYVWCQSNRWNVVLKHESIETIFSCIDGAQSAIHLAHLMCPYSQNFGHGEANGETQDSLHTPFRWNFVNFTDPAKGKIELRRPPSPLDSDDSALWVKFAVSFVQGGNLHGDRLKATLPPSMALFKRILLDGADNSGIQNSEDLTNLLRGKQSLQSGASDPKAGEPAPQAAELYRAWQNMKGSSR